MYRYIILYVFMLLSKMPVHSIPRFLPPSLFIVLAFNIVAPPIIYDARLQCLAVPYRIPDGLVAKF